MALKDRKGCFRQPLAALGNLTVQERLILGSLAVLLAAGLLMRIWRQASPEPGESAAGVTPSVTIA